MPAFAPISTDFPYWQKQQKPLFPDLYWNIPEQKTGNITVIGGNSQGFLSCIRISEFLAQTFPLRSVTTVLPDALRSKLTTMSNLNFTPSTSSGSFAKSPELRSFVNNPNFTILAGDFSKNSTTAIALTEAIAASLSPTTSPPAAPTPILLCRDSVDLLVESSSTILQHPHLFIVASMLQLQKVFRVVFYPRMIMLSQPLIPVIETLHKFTLTYPVTILTFHQEQVIVAHSGQVITTPIAETDYAPLSLWSGPLAAKIAALNLYNPGKPLESTASALLYTKTY